MSIDWIHFTPGMSFLGGLLIGLAAGGFVLMNGRIAGISGIIGGLFKAKRGDTAWRLAFIGGLLLAPILYQTFAQLPPVRIEASWPILGLAGLLTGIGTRYGSGCTSGHGVCGLARMSWRSLAATLTFMCAGFFTVFVIRHLIGA